MSGDTEPELCPLCAEPMDATDRATNLCACGYQYCNFCFNRVRDEAERESLPARCPNCRTIYDLDSITMQDINPDELEETLKKQRKRPERKGPAPSSRRKEDLGNVRVVQRNLVYVVGLAMDICYDDLLRGSEYFGRFGKPVKVSVNRSMPPGVNSTKNGPSGSAYVTFRRPQDAQACIEGIDGALWHGRMVRACFGTTKYCNAFLKGVPCNNTDCLYLHAVADEEDSFTKEQMLSGEAATQFVSLTHPPALKQRAMAAAAAGGPPSGGMHSATASSSVHDAVAPPAPRQALQRSATLPITQPTPAAVNGSMDTLPSPAAAASSTSSGPTWATISAAQQAPVAPPPTPPSSAKPAADQEWPTLGSGERSISPTARPEDPAAAPAAVAGAASPVGGTKAAGETMAAQLARTKSAPSSAASPGMTRSASGKKLAAGGTAPRPWAAGKTLVPPPPPLAAASAITAESSKPVQTLTLPLPSKRDSRLPAAPAPQSDAKPAAVSAAGPAQAPAEHGKVAAAPDVQPAPLPVTATVSPVAMQTRSPQPMSPKQQQPQPQPLNGNAEENQSGALKQAAQVQPKARRPPPGFETPLAAPRRLPPPGFETSYAGPNANGVGPSNLPLPGGVSFSAAPQQAPPASLDAPSAEPTGSGRMRRQSRFLFARAEAEAAEAAAGRAQGATGNVSSPPALLAGPSPAGSASGAPMASGSQRPPPPGFGSPPAGAGMLFPTMQPSLAAGGFGMAGFENSTLQPGAALLRQLQASPAAAASQLPRSIGDGGAFGDPAVMTARVTRIPLSGVQPLQTPSASQRPPPGFQIPAVSAPGSTAAAQTNGFPMVQAQQVLQEVPTQPLAPTQAASAPATAPDSPPHAGRGNGSSASAAPAVAASPRSSRGGKKKRGGKGRGGKGGDS